MNVVVKEYFPEGESQVSPRKVAIDLTAAIKEGERYHLGAYCLGFMKEVFNCLKDMN